MESQEPKITDRDTRELDNLNDNILDNSPIAIHVVDSDFRVLKWNKYLEKSTSIKKADILGKNLLEVIPSIRDSGRYTAMRRVMTSGEPFHELGQKTIRSVGAKKGEVRYQDVSLVPLREQGEVTGVITILSDVTERKLAEEKMRQAELEVAQSRMRLADFSRLQTVGELTAIIAHEISQPLASVEGYAQAAMNHLARGEVEPARLMEVLAKIKEQARRASGIVEHTRSLVKTHKLSLTLIDLNELVLETVKLVELEFMIPDCELRLSLFDHPLFVMADKIQVQRVITNLLHNAIEAVVGMGGEKTIELISRAEQNTIQLVVADRGGGVLPEDEAKLFEPFYSTKEGGLGIGLGFCRSIMEAHGGTARYNKRTGGGAEFLLVFPMADVRRM